MERDFSDFWFGQRAVHPCWPPERIARLRQASAATTLNEEQIFRSVQKQTPEYDIVEDLLKGVEEPLAIFRSGWP